MTDEPVTTGDEDFVPEGELSEEQMRWVLMILQNIEWSRKDGNVENLITLLVHIPSTREAIEAKQALTSMRKALESLMTDGGQSNEG